MRLHGRGGYPEVVCELRHKLFDFVLYINETSFFLARQTIVSARHSGMAPWREALFAWLSCNAQAASDYFKIPSNRVIELDAQIEI